MNSQEKTTELKRILYNSLLPLITANYAFLDIPYYSNLGDTLIWKGTLELLKKTKYKCIWSTNFNANLSKKISSDNIILLQGGGNFGDIWRKHQEFRMHVIEKYPQNNIIILPQTIYYENLKTLNSDATFFNKYPNVTICARDIASYKIAKEYFINNKILLLPDMAFCIDSIPLQFKTNTESNLFIKRSDKEFNISNKYIIPDDTITLDWPLPYPSKAYKNLHRLENIIQRLNFNNLRNYFINKYWQSIILPYHVKLAIDFISPYDNIYTTRLHGCILSVLMGKNIVLFDNSYGKNYSFYETWLKDLESIKYIG